MESFLFSGGNLAAVGKSYLFLGCACKHCGERALGELITP